MSDDLNTQIEQAQRALAQVQELEALKAQADLLPGLLAEKNRNEQRAQAAAHLLQVQRVTKAALDDARATIPPLAERLQAALGELDAIAAEASMVYRSVFDAGRQVRQASERLVSVDWDPSRVGELSPSQSDGGASAKFAQSWGECGGCDAALALVIEDDAILDYLERHGLKSRYDPRTGARSFYMPKI
ncbi:MAG: hypothetical protein JW850_15775 [Thermoflexales bacterium]|nr:hypothetical protein [Thermoflexales bacterium]